MEEKNNSKIIHNYMLFLFQELKELFLLNNNFKIEKIQNLLNNLKYKPEYIYIL